MLALVVPCAAVVLATLLVAWVWRDPLARTTDSLKLEAAVLSRLDAWRAKSRLERLSSAIMLGDSLVNCLGRPVSAALGPALAARGYQNQVVPIAQRGFRALHYYALLADILAGMPRGLVIAVDLRSFSPTFVFSHALEYPGVTRRLSFRRSLAISDVLREEGMTLLDPPIYRAEEALDLLDVPTGVRVLTGELLERGGDAVRGLTGLQGAPLVVRVFRYLPGFPTADQARADYLVDQAGSSGARVLRDIVDASRQAGRPPLLYVSPVDVERLEALGLRDELRLDERVAALHDAIGVTAGEWLDLHAALPASFFRDRFNHLTQGGCTRVAEALAQKLTGRP